MSVLRSFATAVLVVSTGSCSSAPPSEIPPAVPSETEGIAGAPAQSPDPVVVVTIDGARWQDVIDDGELMPTLHSLARDRGGQLVVADELAHLADGDAQRLAGGLPVQPVVDEGTEIDGLRG